MGVKKGEGEEGGRNGVEREGGRGRGEAFKHIDR